MGVGQCRVMEVEVIGVAVEVRVAGARTVVIGAGIADMWRWRRRRRVSSLGRGCHRCGRWEHAGMPQPRQGGVGMAQAPDARHGVRTAEAEASRCGRCRTATLVLLAEALRTARSCGTAALGHRRRTPLLAATALLGSLSPPRHRL
ncbi:hypothetical protein GUJ93_ZPchr0006g40696 [Zizania palustris]|uniref:Uncharacterized protein n=1 Tax=Zizania palustris TaxID=103762 RepID=A0A8J5T0Q1_ZIZPA|nr:hypothetical protein GUJ93_ZPchr0006g40696 [Zizania palustris]